jgi:isoamylase
VSDPYRDQPPALGVHLRTGDVGRGDIGQAGADVAVYAGHADAVEICLLDHDDAVAGPERRIELPGRRHGVHHGFVPGVTAGTRYGFRAHGPWEPAKGLRHNPAKLLIDPYARGIEGRLDWRPEVYGHVVDDHLAGDGDAPDDRDSGPYVPHGVALADDFDWGPDTAPLVPWSSTVLYEAHVRGLTRRMPDLPEHLRGTYAGVAHPATLAHLTGLGVTTVQLLPVHTFVSEPQVARRGLVNYWGYNSLGFFAPHVGYASRPGAAAALTEFKGMVRLLHAAGLEVVLDVVYNHTCEQGQGGPTLSWRGLDQAAYYRLDGAGRDVDLTGCGNTLDFGHPRVVQMALDSLRYWVQQCHVDGFRFDLATTLGRGRDGGYDPDHPFLVALSSDPVLSRVKLIAEPWDVGPDGWQTGRFPPPLAEWNDRYRDTVRSFWLPDAARALRGEAGPGVQDLATRLSGSQDLFGDLDRGPIASINYVAAHDGFTLADLTAYHRKRNLPNGEDNRDGHDDNRSWNHGSIRAGLEGLGEPGDPDGQDGPTADPALAAERRRSIRNLLGTLLLSTGVPMLAAGDELGRTQLGNNNAYCQDDETSWLDWDLADWQHDLLAVTRHLIRLRREHPALRQAQFFGGRPPRADGTADLAWYAADGSAMDPAHWQDPQQRVLQALWRNGSVGAGSVDAPSVGGRSVLLVVQGGAGPVEVTLPTPRGAGLGRGPEHEPPAYELLWDSGQDRPTGPAAVGSATQVVPPRTVQLYADFSHLWTNPGPNGP